MILAARGEPRKYGDIPAARLLEKTALTARMTIPGDPGMVLMMTTMIRRLLIMAMRRLLIMALVLMARMKIPGNLGDMITIAFTKASFAAMSQPSEFFR